MFCQTFHCRGVAQQYEWNILWFADMRNVNIIMNVTKKAGSVECVLLMFLPLSSSRNWSRVRGRKTPEYKLKIPVHSCLTLLHILHSQFCWRTAQLEGDLGKFFLSENILTTDYNLYFDSTPSRGWVYKWKFCLFIYLFICPHHFFFFSFSFRV